MGLIEPDELAFRLDLTPAELKLTYSALKALLNDFGHDEHDVQQIIRSVLNKLPTAGEHRVDRPSPPAPATT